MMREAFYAATTSLLADDPRTALVLADISAAGLTEPARRHPDRVLNVGIREQLMVSVAGGLALAGLRPLAHSYAPFLIERAWEQIKLDLDHQGSGAILVSVGASYDSSASGRTHHSPGDVALLDTLDGWTVQVPGHPDEVGPMIRSAATHDRPVYLRLAEDQNEHPHQTDGRLTVLRRGRQGLAIAVGPMLAPLVRATEGLDLTLAYTNTPRPWDAAGLRELAWDLVDPPVVIVVEPYLAGTSAHAVATALTGVAHRLVSLGVGRTDLHRYGTRADHARAHSLDAASLRATITAALSPSI